MTRRFYTLVSVIGVVALTLGLSLRAEAFDKQLVAGAGPSTVVATRFFELFAILPEAEGYLFIVPEHSDKHAGGIANSDRFLFGRTGRPLNQEELNLGKAQLFLAKVPAAFVVGTEAGVGTLTQTQLESIYAREVTRWSEVGGADIEIFLMGREPTEAMYERLKLDLPFLAKAQFDATLNTDSQVVNFIHSSKGVRALAFGARPNFEQDHVLQIPGLTAGLCVGLVYDHSNEDSPVIAAARSYALSDGWKATLEELGLSPCDE